MKLKKLVKKVGNLIDADRQEQVKQCDTLKKTLGQLKKKAKELEKEIHKANDKDERKELEKKLKIVNTQRRKGLSLLKKLNKKCE